LTESERKVPSLTRAQVVEVDRLAAEVFSVPVEWLMEAAGWQIARHCRARTAVLCGTGNNGGDGLAAARHLHRWGRLHSVSVTDRDRLRGPAAREALALEAAGVEIRDGPDLVGSQLVLDAIFGTGLDRPPEGLEAQWIKTINVSGRRVLSADLPSGLDADTGLAPGEVVRADLTVTLGLPKAGLLLARGPELAGAVWVVDIGIPPQAYGILGVDVPPHLFAMHDRVELGSLRL
jgi:hydroxyethylthiazole kinase-like uncharacterized protein yjeF